MKRRILVLGIILLTYSNALALRPASRQDKEKLAAIIAVIDGAKEKVAKLKFQKENLSKGDSATRSAIDRKIAATIAGMMPHCDEAVQLALIAYDIVPNDGYGRAIMPSGRSVSRGPTNGTGAHWLLVARENRPISWVRPDGSAAPPGPVPGTPNGATTPDGVSRIFPEAFVSPDWLAGVLVHERLHFQQYITSQQADIKTPAELEVDAYTEDLILAERLGFSETELTSYKASVDAKIIENAKIAKIQRAEFDEAKRKNEPPPDLFATSHTKAELDVIKQKTAALAVKVAEESYQRHLEALRAMARNACVDPDFVTQAQLNEIRFMWPATYYDVASLGIPRAPCAERLFALFILDLYNGGGSELAPQRVTQLAEQVRRELRPPSVEPPSVPAPVDDPGSRENVLKEYQRQIRRCGLEPMMDGNGSYTYGFKVAGDCEYYFTGQMNLGEAKMAVFLARACFQGRGDEAPCNEAPALIDQYWSNPGFRAKLELETTSGPHEDCLRVVRDGLTLPFEMRKLDKLVRDFWKDYNKGANRRMKDSERQQRREREDAQRARRTPGERGGSGGHDIDLTPAQDVLDRLRR